MRADAAWVSVTSSQPSGTSSRTAEATRGEVEACLRAGIHAVYQPIVDLATRETIAFEALARPPAGAAFESPGPLFAAAKRVGLVAELDFACRRAAIEGAASLPPGATLFVNIEPEVIGATPPEQHASLFESAPDGLHVVLEITERALTDRTPELLVAVEAARAAGRSIAIDDVGTNPEAVALLPFVRPDVLRIDGSLVQGGAGRKAAYVAVAVRAYAEQTGAMVLAECIEDAAHLDAALAFGATAGQGWLFGRPGPIPAGTALHSSVRRLTLPALEHAATSPFCALRAAGAEPRVATHAVVKAIGRQLESEAIVCVGRPVVLSSFQSAQRFSEVTEHYDSLGHRCAFVAAFGVGIDPAPTPAVRGIPIVADDVLADEWAVVVTGPRFQGALVARDMGDPGGGDGRRYEFVVTHEAGLVQAAVESLMRRVVASARGHRLS